MQPQGSKRSRACRPFESYPPFCSGRNSPNSFFVFDDRWTLPQKSTNATPEHPPLIHPTNQKLFEKTPLFPPKNFRGWLPGSAHPNTHRPRSLQLTQCQFFWNFSRIASSPSKGVSRVLDFGLRILGPKVFCFGGQVPVKQVLQSGFLPNHSPGQVPRLFFLNHQCGSWRVIGRGSATGRTQAGRPAILPPLSLGLNHQARNFFTRL